MVNKKIAAGLVGAAGVAAATQVPAVQAGVEQLTQKGQDTESLAKATSSSQIKEENVKNKGIKTNHKVAAKVAADTVDQVVTSALNVISSAGTIVATPASQEAASDTNVADTSDVTSSTSNASVTKLDNANVLTPAESAAVESSQAAQPVKLSADVNKYKVIDGDTLSNIANRFGVSYSSLLAANPGLTGSSLRVGQYITIPTTSDSQQTPAQEDSVSKADSSAAPTNSGAATNQDQNTSATAPVVDESQNQATNTDQTDNQPAVDDETSHTSDNSQSNNNDVTPDNNAGQNNTVDQNDAPDNDANQTDDNNTANNDNQANDNNNVTAGNDDNANAGNDVNTTPGNDTNNNQNNTGDTNQNNNSGSEVDGISAAQQATLDALNVLRTSRGLRPVVWDARLAMTAQGRANLVASTGQIPDDHWSWGAGPEVIAIDWPAGSSVINAWNIDDASVGMITNNLGHRRWLLSPDTTKVGFGINGNVIDGISNGTDFTVI
ncbi:LysM peptidoglycan-binding domain-containing protein [Weissella kandleri]|uniref:LysM peptidoglycan-binding domain-containing protein n=1 Tax=Weissella kandleri TaxID=1616 RepID=UPI00387E6424